MALRQTMPQRARGNALRTILLGFAALSVTACAGTKSATTGGQPVAQAPAPVDGTVAEPPAPGWPKIEAPLTRPKTRTPAAPVTQRPRTTPQPSPDPFQVLPPDNQPPLATGPSFAAPAPAQPTYQQTPTPLPYQQAAAPVAPSPLAVQNFTYASPVAAPAPYAPSPVPPSQGVKRFTFASLPGWANGDHAPVLASLRESCEKISDGDPYEGIGGAVFNGEPVFGRAGDWQPICAEAYRTQSADARGFFERWFEPVSVNGAGEEQASLYTAYFEPELRGSRTRGGPYQYPIYRKPPELTKGAPFFERADIQRGAIAGRGLELFWIDDPVEAFFLEIQGSGRVRLPDGQVARVGYAGKNGRPYKAIGKTLVEWGAMPLEQVSLQSIKAWIRANPQRRDELLATNRSYVFFIERPELAADPSLGPIGTFGTPLPAMRAIAIDRKTYALGTPFWIDFNSPLGPMQRLVLALDTGGAIKGSRRADFFFGSGAGPEQAAGATRARGRLIALAPTAALRRVFRAGS